jgi:hypothetical protein
MNTGKLLKRPDETQNKGGQHSIPKLPTHDFWSRLLWATAEVRVTKNGCYLSITKLNIFASPENAAHSNI